MQHSCKSSNQYYSQMFCLFLQHLCDIFSVSIDNMYYIFIRTYFTATFEVIYLAAKKKLHRHKLNKHTERLFFSL